MAGDLQLNGMHVTVTLYNSHKPNPTRHRYNFTEWYRLMCMWADWLLPQIWPHRGMLFACRCFLVL